MPFIILLASAIFSLVLVTQKAQINTSVDNLFSSEITTIEQTVTSVNNDIDSSTIIAPQNTDSTSQTVLEPTVPQVEPVPPAVAVPEPVSDVKTTPPPPLVPPEIQPSIERLVSPPAPSVPETIKLPEQKEENVRPQIEEKEKTPEAKFNSPHPGKTRGIMVIELEVKDAESVEFNLRKTRVSISQFLGLGERREGDKWVFPWDTKTVENNHYELYAVIKNQFGSYQSPNIQLAVLNEIVIPEKEREVIIEVKTKLEEKEKVAEQRKEENKIETVNNAEHHLQEFSEELKKQATPQEARKIEQIVKQITPEVKKNIEANLKRFDENVSIIKHEEVKQKNAEILSFESAPIIEKEKENRERIKKDTEDKIKIEEQKKDDVRKEIIGKMEEARVKLEEVLPEAKRQEIESAKIEASKKSEDLIAAFEQQTNQAEEQKASETPSSVFKDSDGDGISDYDEVFRFNTNAFTEDSDGDGFKDGVEVLGGYNPNDSLETDKIEYENPKETGITQPQQLKVEELKVETEEIEPGVTVIKKIEIKGKAQPNTFVTIYIYSLPVIVTVKTDIDGVWTYTLDKELEDGKHEVYVATTDNTGKIAAKSEALPFVKQASAVIIGTGIARAAATTEIQKVSFLSTDYLILILSTIALTFGVALLIIGLISLKREREQILKQPESKPDEKQDEKKDSDQQNINK